jgi:hypothetical protein
MNMRYASARSAGFGILIWGIILVLVISMVIIPPQYRTPTIAGSLMGIGFILWIWYGTFYEFKQTYLLVKMGPFFERIPYSKITSARKFRSMVSSMALSNEMIELRHGKNYITGTTYISPKDRDGFIEQLKFRSTGIDVKTKKVEL